MSKLPAGRDTGNTPPSLATISAQRVTRAQTRTVVANASKVAKQQSTTVAEPGVEIRPSKESTENAKHAHDTPPLLFIAETLTLFLGAEKVGAEAQKKIEKVIAFAREADAMEKNKVPSPALQPEADQTRLAIRVDLIQMYEALAQKLDGINNTANTTLSNVNKLSSKTSEISGESKNLVAQLGKVSESTDKIASSTTAYRDAVLTSNNQAPKTMLDPRVLRDMERRDKQIWVEVFDEGEDRLMSKSLTALVEQANKAMESMEDKDKPKGAKVDAALKTRSGALILTLNSRESASWLHRIDMELTFTRIFAKGSSFRERRFNLIVPRVPLVFDPENPEHLRELEEANGLGKHVFQKAKWIKPAARRRPDQTHAFLMLTAVDVGAANTVIRDGIFICSTRVRPTKHKQEPMQCMKCHKWGHFASDCKAESDTCGTCGEAHRTMACTNKGKTYCVSCGNNSHPSWDRRCPEFTRRCAIFDERNPENRMPYFPSGEDWTLAVKPSIVPVSERFPSKFAVNSLPAGNSRAGKRRQDLSREGKERPGNHNLVPLGRPRMREGTGGESPIVAGGDWMAEMAGPSTLDAHNTDETHPRDYSGWN